MGLLSVLVEFVMICRMVVVMVVWITILMNGMVFMRIMTLTVIIGPFIAISRVVPDRLCYSEWSCHYACHNEYHCSSSTCP